MEVKSYFCERCGANIIPNITDKKGICHFCGSHYILDNRKPIIVTQNNTTVIRQIFGNVYGNDNEKLFDNAHKLIDIEQADKAKLIIDKLICEETKDYRTWLLLIKYELTFFNIRKATKTFDLKIQQYINLLIKYLDKTDIGNYLVFQVNYNKNVIGLACCYIGKNNVIEIPDFGYDKLVKFYTSENFGKYDVNITSDFIDVGAFAFSNCFNLRTIVLPESIQHMEHKVFENCNNLLRVIFEFKSNVLSNNNSGAIKSLLWNNDKLGAINLLIVSIKNIKIISSSVFYSLQNITHIICNNNVLEIKSNMLILYFSETLLKICAYSFAECKQLICVELSNSIEHIGDNAFQNCNNILFFTINSSDIILGNSVFEGFTNKQKIMINISRKQVNYWAKKWKKGCNAKISYVNKEDKYE